LTGCVGEVDEESLFNSVLTGFRLERGSAALLLQGLARRRRALEAQRRLRRAAAPGTPR
jgi:hypothetical protein